MVLFEVIQLIQLYDRKREQLDENAKRSIEKIAFVHEKGEDFKRFQQIIDKDFSSLYKKILENEFTEILSSEQKVSIQDTSLIQNGKIVPYLIVRGTAKDSLSGVQTEQTTLIKDVRQLRDFFKDPNSSSKKSEGNNIAIHLDQKLLQNVFKKAKFVNELMLQAFKENVYKSPNQRLDIGLLDSVIGNELLKQDLPKNYSFAIMSENGEILNFTKKSRFYNRNINKSNSMSTKLYPTDIINEELTLYLSFPRERAYLLKEMESYIILTGILILLMIATLIFMYKTIVQQRKISEMKTDFISNMTHEFKTPISTISLACEALNDKDVVSNSISATISPFVKMISEENNRLGNLVESILQSAVINKGEIEFKKETVDLILIINNLLKSTVFRMPNNGEIIKKINGTPRTIIADSLHTSNLIANLLDNAIKYSNEVPRIEMNITYNTKTIVLSVKDNGIGIDKQYLPKIFDKLYRIPKGNVHNVKGFGLGLNYVKAICDAHGWEINVSSELGIGTEFKIIIK